MTFRVSGGNSKYGSIRSGADISDVLAESKDRKVETPVSVFQQIRDICESLVVALFLAFLFKTFEAEAFVIPTGSMAPTLKGRHKDVVCDECHFRFQTSASEEVDSATNRRNGRHVVAGTCPQCGYTQYFGDDLPETGTDKVAPSYTGDRILVSKIAFDQRELQRFDVSVFRAPAEPKVNFIKRIVGFPNERLRVQYGDLFVQKVAPSVDTECVNGSDDNRFDNVPSLAPDVNLSHVGNERFSGDSVLEDDIDAVPFEIQRKDYRHLRQIMQVVYDADYTPEKLDKLGWPQRWTDDWERQQQGVRGWTTRKSRKGCAFVFTGEAVESDKLASSSVIEPDVEADVSPVAADDPDLAWLRYRHIVPTSNDWRYLSQERLPPDVEATGVVANNPRLIDDFSSYNAGISRQAHFNSATGTYEWVDSHDDEFSQLSSRVSEVGDSERIFCRKNPDGFGCNWVGDLGISCVLKFQSMTNETDRLVFDLVKGGVVFRCVIFPSEGTVSLEIPGIEEFTPVMTTCRFRAGKRYEFAFFNVDEEMRVVVDGEELVFSGSGGRYDFLTTSDDENLTAPIPRNRDPNARDLAPVAVGVRGLSVVLERLVVLRDVYYIAAGRGLETWDSTRFVDFGATRCDRLARDRVFLGNEEDAARFMSSPDLWSGYGNTKSALLRQREGQYVAFGDNSGFSLDSRLWASNTIPHYVDRKYLIGKAFYVYWPHGKPLPLIGGPFWPDFSKMRHVD